MARMKRMKKSPRAPGGERGEEVGGCGRPPLLRGGTLGRYVPSLRPPAIALGTVLLRGNRIDDQYCFQPVLRSSSALSVIT
jgi:hypothetical protein